MLNLHLWLHLHTCRYLEAVECGPAKMGTDIRASEVSVPIHRWHGDVEDLCSRAGQRPPAP